MPEFGVPCFESAVQGPRDLRADLLCRRPGKNIDISRKSIGSTLVLGSDWKASELVLGVLCAEAVCYSEFYDAI